MKPSEALKEQLDQGLRDLFYYESCERYTITCIVPNTQANIDDLDLHYEVKQAVLVRGTLDRFQRNYTFNMPLLTKINSIRDLHGDYDHAMAILN